MWDTAGQEKFRSVAKSYFKNADGIILVYDINNRLTFKSMNFWLEEFENNSKNFDSSLPKKPALILGNKSDFDDQFKQISTIELEKFADENQLIAREVSAKKNSGKQIQSAINDLIDLIVELSKLFFLINIQIKIKNQN